MLNFSNYYIFLIPLVVLLTMRGIKFIIYLSKHDWDFQCALEHAMGHGHMPSVHTGLVVSMLTSIGYYDGLSTGAFAVAVVFAILTVDDATRLRIYMGNQGRYLNMLAEDLKLDKIKYPHLKERVGHKISEVIVGGILGFILTFLLIFSLSSNDFFKN